MKKIVSSVVVLFFAAFIFAIPANKSIVGFYTSPFENPVSFEKGVHTDSEPQFGGAYLWGDIVQGNNYVTAGGKIYYRLGSVADGEEETQKLDLKRAYIKVRPTGTDFFEVALGKLYSYYLSGGYFYISEIYTGNSRWGKTGMGTKFEVAGFTGGIALPVTESYTPFSDSFSLAAGLSYDFAFLNTQLPLELGFSAVQDFIENDFGFTASAQYSPEVSGFISKTKFFVSYSYNAEPFVTNAGFKNVSNYADSDLKKSQFVSVNFRMNLGSVQLITEGEAGHSVDGNLIPLYSGTQVLIPLTEHIALKPRFLYYAALCDEDSDLGRQTFEFYPRLWLTFGKCTVSAGGIITLMQTGTSKKDATQSDWFWGWKLPMYVEWKF